MRDLVLRDTTVELTTRDDDLLTDAAHLVLEIALNGELVDKTNLWSQDSARGVWNADKVLVLKEVTSELMVSVSMKNDENNRQLLGFAALRGPELFDTVGRQYELSLTCQANHRELVLRTKVSDKVQEATTGAGEYNKQPAEDVIEKMLSKGVAAYQDFANHGNLQSLDEAILDYEAAAKFIPESDPRLYRALNDLGGSLFSRFRRFGRLIDLNNGIERLERAVDLTPDGDPNKSRSLNNLGSFLRARFERFGNLVDVDNAVMRHQAAVDLTLDDHPDKPGRLNNLCNSLRTRFERLGNLPDLDSAITQQQAAVNLTLDGHPHKPGFLNNLGSLLQMRFERLGNIADIDGAITQQQLAVNLTTDDHPEKPMYLRNLGNSLGTRFRRLGNLADIDSAITHQRAAVNLFPDGHPDKPMYLNNLGTSLRTRFKRLGSLADINDAVAQSQVAVSLFPDDHPAKPGNLNNLGNSLRTRFERLGNLVDINNAIIHQQVVVSLTPDDHPDKPMYLNNLGNSFQTRFERLSNLADIDSAITQQQAAVNLTPQGHPNKPGYLQNLGNALQLRFGRLGDLVDLDNAITQKQAAVDLTPDGHPAKPGRLNNLGDSLRVRFERLGNLVDINIAITRQQAAIKFTPNGHPDKPTYLNNLGISLETRFHRLGNLVDIDDAITQTQAAADLVPDGHPDKPIYLNSLGNSYQTRFIRLGNLEDINIAIVQTREAVNLTPDGHPQKPLRLYNLGNAFCVRFLVFHQPVDLDLAIYRLSTAAKSTIGSPNTRFMAVQRWISIASLGKHRSLLDAYECAVGLMPIVAWLGLPITDRHQHLVQMGGLARDAAAAAISSGQYDKALEWLEQGRSIVWNQILQLRTPVDQLRSVNPELADRLVHISRLLDHGFEKGGGSGFTEEEGQRYRALTSEWESIIEQVRALPNFDDFLRPLKTSQLIRVAQNGPVVVLNISRERCDALALVAKSKRVKHIPLPNITAERVTELREELKDLLYSNGIRMRGERAAKKVEDDDQAQDCEPTLSELWTGVVKPVLDSLSFSPHPHVLPRIWWCATGSLAFLPIHAAGIYNPSAADPPGVERKAEVKAPVETVSTSPKPGQKSDSGPTQIRLNGWNQLSHVRTKIYTAIARRLCCFGAVGRKDTTSVSPCISDYVISSYTPTLSALLDSSDRTADTSFKLVSVIQPSAPGVSQIPNTEQELKCIQQRLGEREHVVLNDREGTKARVMKAMSESNWLHLACHGSQRQDEPTKSALILEDGYLTLEEIIKLDLPNAEFAYLSACQTTTGDEALSDEAVHIAGGMLLAGYRGVIATMWSIQDDLAPEVADEFYRRIMGDGGRPNNRKAAEALHYSVERLRKRRIPLTSWIPFVHLGV